MNNELKAKSYEELRFTDDFMFCKVLTENPELCTMLVETLTGRKPELVVPPLQQKVIKPSSDGQGVRFDVVFEGSDTVYDIEMQTSLKTALGKRVRYYQSMTDKTHLDAGKYYDKLPNSLIVFICLQDPFRANLPKYTFHHKCDEAMFLNASSEMNCEEGLRQFLAYLRGKKPTTELTGKIDTAVRKAIDDQSGKERYMTLLERDRENAERGKKEGIKEGIKIGK